MLKKIIANISILSFGMMSLASADFYVTTSSTINLLSSNKIKVTIPEHPKYKLIGSITYSSIDNNAFNIVINWNILEYGNIEQSVDGLTSQLENQKNLTFVNNQSILVRGQLPILPDNKNSKNSFNSDNKYSAEQDKKGAYSLSENGNGNFNKSVFPNNYQYHNNSYIPDNSSSSGSSNSSGGSTSNATDNVPTDDTPNPLKVTTAIDDCTPIYNQENDKIDVYVKDYYYDNDGNKVVKKPCYKLKEVPAEYQECQKLIDYKDKKVYYEREAIYVDKKKNTDVEQTYSASPCLPYQEYNTYFAVADTGCSAYVEGGQEFERGKYYYITQNGARNYTTDCIVDPLSSSIPLSIEYDNCPVKHNIPQNYSTYYGRYYYYNHEDYKVEIGDCQNLGDKSFFPHKLKFLRWDHHINEGYSYAINERYITLNNQDIVITQEEQGIELIHQFIWDGNWINYDQTNYPKNSQVGYSNKEIQQKVTLPDAPPIIFKTFEDLNTREDHKMDCYSEYRNGKDAIDGINYYNCRPDGSKYFNITRY